MPTALFLTSLYAALALCALGLGWRCARWFRVSVGIDARALAPSARFAALSRAVGAALFSRRAPQVLRAFVLDALLLRRLYASAKLRWLAHLLILVGFVLLTLMHALAPLVTAKLFPGYAPTLAPYLFLRNLFGAMLLAGLALILLGRGRARFAKPAWVGDASFVALLAFVLVTGFLLEANKIASPAAFYRMTERYLGTADAAKLQPLRALWASEYGVAFADMRRPPDSALVQQGRVLHAEACASCHARPQSAFVSYPIARGLAPLIARLDNAHTALWLLYLHVFACFLGLASLPFTGFFHAVAAPLNLLLDAAAGRRRFAGAARAAWRGLTLDACVRCGICDTHCAVAPLARYLGNPYLLPSHKLAATGAFARGGFEAFGHETPRSGEAQRIADGAFLCTDCARCTSRCPVGLDLADLWPAARAELRAAGWTAPAQRAQGAGATPAAGEQTRALPGIDPAQAPLAADRDLFARCVQCQTCTNVCPVAAQGAVSGHGVDLTPQKVMNLLRLGLVELTLGSRMVWSCATCYQCQEHCPEGIRVADIMSELRTVAVRRLGWTAAREDAR